MTTRKHPKRVKPDPHVRRLEIALHDLVCAVNRVRRFHSGWHMDQELREVMDNLFRASSVSQKELVNTPTRELMTIEELRTKNPIFTQHDVCDMLAEIYQRVGALEKRLK